SYILQSGRDAFHATFIASSEEGEVQLSHEHSEFKWMLPSSYLQDYLPTAFDPDSKSHASFYAQLKLNIASLRQAP
ncbi:MAG: hypothetical protein ABIS18_05935, partial [Actinomycetota bacterium]